MCGGVESGSEGAIREYPGQVSSIKIFKVILNFTWKDQRVESSKEQFWRTTDLLRFLLESYLISVLADIKTHYKL